MTLMTLLTWVAVTVSTITGPAAPGPSQSTRFAGRPVAEVLRELQSADLRIIFSSDLVPSELRVFHEPKSREPRQIAAEILEPHGLGLQNGPRGTLLVVVRPRTGPPKSSPKGSQPKYDQPGGEAASKPDAIRIEERVDVSDRLSDAPRPAGGYTIRSDDVRETAGGMENVFVPLQILPGSAATNDEDGRIAVRGAGPEYNLVVFDGVQVHNPYRYSELTSSFLNPEIAARVTLDASGLDASYGGRLSAVTVIETRDGSRDRKLAVTGSLGLASGDLLLEGRLPRSETGSWWLATRGTYYRPVVGLFRSDVLPSFADVQFKMTTHPTPRTRLAAFALVGGEASHNREPTGTEGDLTVAQYQGNNRLGFVTFVWSPQSRMLTRTTASVSSHNARDFDSYLAPGVSKSVIEPFERNIAVDDLAVRQQVLYALSPRLVVGSGVEWHQLRSRWVMRGLKPPVFARGLGPSTWGEGIQYPAGGVIESRLARSHVGLWTQVEVPLGSALFLEPGVRLDWNSYTDESSWQPRLRLRGRIGETTWWTGIAAQVQTPSHESLQGFDYFHFSQSNVERLRNARGLQAVAGVERRLLARTNLRIEAYHRRFDRLLVQRLETEAERTERLRSYAVPADMPADSAFLEFRPTIYPESSGGGRARGIEVLVRHEGIRFGGWIGYALARTEQQMYGYASLSDFDRSHALSAVATFRIARRWTAAATWRQSSGFAVTPITEDVLFLNNPRPDGTRDPVARPARHSDGSLMLSPSPFVRPLAERNSDRLGVYSRTDARLTYSTLGRWEVYGEVINLFGARNYSQVIPPPSFARGEAPDSKQNVYELFERIPAFGIRVKF